MNRLGDRMKAVIHKVVGTTIGLALVAVATGGVAMTRAQQAQTKEQAPAAKPQPRLHGQRVKVDPAAITVEDGDGVIIRWGDKDDEIVRILGIDTPEVRRLEHNLPYDQPFGLEAKAFGQGAFA